MRACIAWLQSNSALGRLVIRIDCDYEWRTATKTVVLKRLLSKNGVMYAPSWASLVLMTRCHCPSGFGTLPHWWNGWFFKLMETVSNYLAFGLG